MQSNHLDLTLKYRVLISSVSEGFGDLFPALATPTLSKQETVTALYKSIEVGVQQNKKLSFPWRDFVAVIPRLLWMFTKCCYASSRFRVKNLPKNAVYFRTWLVPRCFSGNELSDDYFRQLPKDLEDHEAVVVGFTSLEINLLNQYARTPKPTNYINAYGLLSLWDICKLFFDYIFTGLIQTKLNHMLNGVNVTRYINHSLLLDYLRLRSFEAFAEKHKCRKLIAHNIKAFVYVFENQSWEKACCAILRRHNIRIIGYQSSGFSPVFLNFFPTAYDAKYSLMPDVLLTVGDYFRQYLLEHGHYEIPVETFAALRFDYDHYDLNYNVLSPNLSIIGRILYAFSVHIEQYSEIISDLIMIFSHSGIQVDLKLHPLYQLSNIKNITRLPDNFKIVFSVDTDNLQSIYDCVLFNDNSFGIEALLQGVKSYQYHRHGNTMDNRFLYFNLWKTNYSYTDLEQLRDSITNQTYDKSFDMTAVSSYVNSMYRPYSKRALNRFQSILSVEEPFLQSITEV